MSLPAPNWTAQDIVAHLRSIGTMENRTGMARFGINTALGTNASSPEKSDRARGAAAGSRRHVMWLEH
ncbi:hypothetical protein [Mesorhizobium sp. ES1-3]|uniref:hypothetical protein n=1 Tax=Mesorhizobium sp. ES1-3 TaxID=2876628 RepID=UPI001CCFFE87|nr:hypothetical protein [Mesorhizobium sp. ES1-3]MBZ9669111.1 hypothetical protein [Mesorhizobium sp. ES1-3]